MIPKVWWYCGYRFSSLHTANSKLFVFFGGEIFTSSDTRLVPGGYNFPVIVSQKKEKKRKKKRRKKKHVGYFETRNASFLVFQNALLNF
jgi:hypothetical protein